VPHINESIAIDADPDRVWAVAGDPATISDWLPAIATSSVDGEQRSCTTVDGADLRRRIVERSDHERFYVASVISYRSRVAVQASATLL